MERFAVKQLTIDINNSSKVEVEAILLLLATNFYYLRLKDDAESAQHMYYQTLIIHAKYQSMIKDPRKLQRKGLRPLIRTYSFARQDLLFRHNIVTAVPQEMTHEQRDMFNILKPYPYPWTNKDNKLIAERFKKIAKEKQESSKN